MENQRTDLAHEMISSGIKKEDSTDFKSFKSNGFDIISVNINEKRAKKLGVSTGKYLSICCGKAWMYNNEYKNALTNELSKQLKSFLMPNYKKILICCIGNPEITADSIGPRVGDKIFVNRHLKSSKDTFKQVSSREISLISPGVIGQCGIGIEELARCVSNLVNADLIITIDALASKKIENLGTAIQISNVGIRPGSGVGGNRQEISQSTTGLPVVSIGLPTVIEYSSLSIPSTTERLLVSPKEIDLIISAYSSIIARGINQALKDF